MLEHPIEIGSMEEYQKMTFNRIIEDIYLSSIIEIRFVLIYSPYYRKYNAYAITIGSEYYLCQNADVIITNMKPMAYKEAKSLYGKTYFKEGEYGF